MAWELRMCPLYHIHYIGASIAHPGTTRQEDYRGAMDKDQPKVQDQLKPEDLEALQVFRELLERHQDQPQETPSERPG